MMCWNKDTFVNYGWNGQERKEQLGDNIKIMQWPMKS